MLLAWTLIERQPSNHLELATRRIEVQSGLRESRELSVMGLPCFEGKHAYEGSAFKT
jgi:hypothetical protein